MPHFIACLTAYYPKLRQLNIETEFHYIQKEIRRYREEDSRFKCIKNPVTSVELPCPRSELERYCQEKGITLKIE